MPEDPLIIFRTVFASACAFFTLIHLPWFVRALRIWDASFDDAQLPPEHMRENKDVDESELVAKNPLQKILPTLNIPAFIAVGIAFVILMLCAACSVYPRVSLLLAIVAYLVFFKTVIWTSKVARKTSLIPWTCLLLAVMPEDPQTQSLTVMAIKVLLIQMWFSAALHKLTYAKDQWLNGNALRYNLIREPIQNTQDPERAIGTRLAFMPALVIPLAIAVLLVELTSPLVLLNTTALLGAIAYVVFLGLHLGIYALWRLDYLSFCYLPIGGILLIPSTYPFAEIFPAAFGDINAMLTMAVIIVLVVNIFLRIESWPLHTWPMFASAPEFSSMKIHRLIAFHGTQKSVVQAQDRYLNRGISRHGPYLRWIGEYWARTNAIDPSTIDRLELEMVTVQDTNDALRIEPVTSFKRLSQLERWRWLPPWEEIYQDKERLSEYRTDND